MDFFVTLLERKSKVNIMATITLKINERSKAGKMVKDLLELIADKPGVEII